MLLIKHSGLNPSDTEKLINLNKQRKNEKNDVYDMVLGIDYMKAQQCIFLKGREIETERVSRQ